MGSISDLGGDIFLQYGFASVCVVLFAILIWLIKALLLLQKETNKVIQENTTTNRRIVELQERQTQNLDMLKEKLISRPCIAQKE